MPSVCQFEVQSNIAHKGQRSGSVTDQQAEVLHAVTMATRHIFAFWVELRKQNTKNLSPSKHTHAHTQTHGHAYTHTKLIN